MIIIYDIINSNRTESTLTAVLSEAWAKLREWAILAGKGRLLLSGSVVLASLKAPVDQDLVQPNKGSNHKG